MAAKVRESLATQVAKYMNIRRTSRFVLRRSYDSWALRQIYFNQRRDAAIKKQAIRVDQHAELGSDLAVAIFVISKLGGRIKNESGQWINSRKDLPTDFNETFQVTAVDASQTSLLTEGLDNFVGLNRLEFLDLSRNPALDDFACDQLSRQLRNSSTLSDVNLSHNPLISVYGLEILLRIPSLRRITATNTQASKYEDLQLFTLAALDECGCHVNIDDQFRPIPVIETLEEKL